MALRDLDTAPVRPPGVGTVVTQGGMVRTMGMIGLGAFRSAQGVSRETCRDETREAIRLQILAFGSSPHRVWVSTQYHCAP